MAITMGNGGMTNNNNDNNGNNKRAAKRRSGFKASRDCGLSVTLAATVAWASETSPDVASRARKVAARATRRSATRCPTSWAWGLVPTGRQEVNVYRRKGSLLSRGMKSVCAEGEGSAFLS